MKIHLRLPSNLRKTLVTSNKLLFRWFSILPFPFLCLFTDFLNNFYKSIFSNFQNFYPNLQYIWTGMNSVWMRINKYLRVSVNVCQLFFRAHFAYVLPAVGGCCAASKELFSPISLVFSLALIPAYSIVCVKCSWV